jgi:hypothetical protein
MSDTAQPTVTGIGDDVESKGTDENHTPILPAENHTPLLPAENHTPVTPMENHTPLLPAENHTPVAPESATAAGQRAQSQKNEEPSRLLGDEDVSTLENHTPVAPATGEA